MVLEIMSSRRKRIGLVLLVPLGLAGGAWLWYRERMRYSLAEREIRISFDRLVDKEAALRFVVVDDKPLHWVRSIKPDILAGLLDYNAQRDGVATTIRIDWERDADGHLRILAVREVRPDGAHVSLWLPVRSE